MNPKHAVSMIQATYRVDLSTERWLQGLAECASEALGSTQGAMVFRYDASSGDWIQPEPPVLHRLSPEFARDFFDHRDAPRESAVALVRAFMTVRFDSSREIFRKVGGSSLMSPVFERHGVDDLIGINGLDPSGRGCFVGVAGAWRKHSPRAAHLWHRLAAHISAGNRLRGALETLVKSEGDLSNHAEAILTPDGKVEHAEGAAEPRAARNALRAALVRIDAARSEQVDGKRSVELWRGLVAGRWSLVEHFERDGRRYYLAQKNDPELASDRALTPRERQILAYAELGNSNKLIAYTLGLSSSTVATLLGKARRKVGLADR